jgi:catechol 2,3-dioxygenase-like lactoylglutathione lyase family enzyme
MIDHTSLGVRSYRQAVAFYCACLAPLGHTLQRDTGEEAAFGAPEAWGFFLYPAPDPVSIVAERNHVAFRAPSRAAVEAFHRAAVDLGGTSKRPPGGRADIGPDYFGAVLVDPDGHTIEAVHWSKAG